MLYSNYATDRPGVQVPNSPFFAAVGGHFLAQRTKKALQPHFFAPQNSETRRKPPEIVKKSCQPRRFVYNIR